MPMRPPLALTPEHHTAGFSFVCPHCPGVSLRAGKAVVPGAFTMREATCPSCRRDFLAHLEVAYAERLGATLDKASGETDSTVPSPWFLSHWQNAWHHRQQRPVRLTREKMRSLQQPLLVNCIDSMYGHCLQRLFDIPQLIKRAPDRDIIVLVQDFARWLVPYGVAEIWSADLSLREGALWFDDLARQVEERLAALPPVETDGVIDTGAVDITAFTRAARFDYGSPASLDTSIVSLIWRDDRCWTSPGRAPDAPDAAEEQAALMTAVAEDLRNSLPGLDIAVVGIGARGDFPPWIADLRVAPGGKIDEQSWLRRYAASHAVAGVHGSNMLLPAAHAATAVELVPQGKWQHVGDTYDFVRGGDALRVLREIRYVPTSIAVAELAALLRVQIRQAKMQAFWQQESKFATESDRRLFRARYGGIFAYSGD